jgi:hypothetical protein
MPDSHQQYLKWDEARFIRWASQVGPATKEVIRNILASYAIPQHGFRTCMAILKLPPDDRHAELERACAKALTLRQVPSFKTVKSIFKSLEDEPEPQTAHPSEAHAFIRNIGKEASRE